jgi:hypothetical protein
MEKVLIEGVELVLSHSDNYGITWVGKEELKKTTKSFLDINI